MSRQPPPFPDVTSDLPGCSLTSAADGRTYTEGFMPGGAFTGVMLDEGSCLDSILDRATCTDRRTACRREALPVG